MHLLQQHGIFKPNRAAEDRAFFSLQMTISVPVTLSIVFHTLLNLNASNKMYMLKNDSIDPFHKFQENLPKFFICSFPLLHFIFWNYSFLVTASVSWENVLENFRVDCTWVCQAA